MQMNRYKKSLFFGFLFLFYTKPIFSVENLPPLSQTQTQITADSHSNKFYPPNASSKPKGSTETLSKEGNEKMASPKSSDEFKSFPHQDVTKISTSHSNKTDKHIWNLENTDIIKVIAEVSRETGKNFIVDPQVKGNITIVSATALGPDEIYPVFLSALQVLGYGTVQQKGLIKIIPLRDANQANPTVSGNIRTASGDQMLVKVIPLKHVAAMQLAPNLMPLIPNWASVSAYPPSNAIIVSGTASIVSRVTDIITRVDTPSANGIDMIPLHYANVNDMVKELEKLQQASRNTTGDYSSAISVDVRSNSILLAGSDFTRLNYKVLISQLDVPMVQGTSTDTQVIPLQHKPVSAIIPVLRGLARQSVDSSLAQMATSSGQNPSLGNSSGASSNSNGGAAINIAKLPELNNALLNAGASNSNDQTGIIIAGDVATNAIIITAPPNMMRTFKKVIQQIDIPPKQILVQGIIAQISADKLNELGIEWGFSGKVPPHVIGPAPPSYSYGGNGMGVGFINRYDISALVSAIAQDSNSNILSTPSIMVTNNGTADIEIGQSVPISTGTYNPVTGVGGQIVTNYSYQNVGLILNVTPQITGSRGVNMKIVQSNSSIIPTPITTASNGNSPSNPTLSNELITTSVTVKDSQILVLGGLTDTQEEIMVNKVPILGYIPLVGALFQSKKKRHIKRDLFIFLRPVILNDSEDARKVSDTRYDALRQVSQENLTAKNLYLKSSSILPSRSPLILPRPFDH